MGDDTTSPDAGSGASTRGRAGEGSGDSVFSAPGRSPVLDAAQLEVLRRYGTERDVAAGEVLFADGDETYDLIVMLDGTAEIIQGYGRPGATVIAGYGRSQFLGEIGMLTGQRAYLTAVATSAGRVLAVPVAQLRVVMAQEPGLSDLILRTFLLRHSILMRRGAGLTLIGSRFDPDTRRLLEVLARNRLVSTWLDLEASPEAEAILQGLDVPVGDLPIVVIPGGPLLRNPGGRALLDALGMSGATGPYPPGRATCWWWAGARPAWPLRCTAHPRGWPRPWPRKPRWAARRAPRRGSRTSWAFPRACPARNWRRARRCRRRSSASGSSWRRGRCHCRRQTACTRSASTTATSSRPGRSSSPPEPTTTGCPLDRLAEFEGVGVYYAATQAEVQACGDGPVAVVGGGNSAGQAALFLSRSSAEVHVIIRGESLQASMSRYLIDRIEQNPCITVWPRTQVTALTGANRLEGLRIGRAGHRASRNWPSVGCSSSSVPSPGPVGWPVSSPRTATDSCSPAPTSPQPGSPARPRLRCSWRPAGRGSSPLETSVAARSSASLLPSAKAPRRYDWSSTGSRSPGAEMYRPRQW